MKNKNYHITTTAGPGATRMSWNIHQHGKLIGVVFDPYDIGRFIQEYESRSAVCDI